MQAQQKQQQIEQPWLDAGSSVLPTITSGLAPGGQFNKPFTMADAQNMPAYNFALQQGTNAINNTAAAKGGLLNSNNIQDNVKFAVGTAAGFENQAFNQYQQQNALTLGGLESVAGLGQTTAQNVGDTAANATLAAGNAQAAGIVGSANAIGGGISSLTNQMSTLSSLFGGSFNNSGGGPTATSAIPTPTFSSYDSSGMGMPTDPGYSPSQNYSDRRLKTHIKRVGKTHDGTPIYTYKMKGSSKIQMGVMADEVEDVEPSAVSTHPVSGYKMVDYRKVH